MKAIKSYSAFASGIYKLVVFLGLPVVIGLIQLWCCNVMIVPLHSALILMVSLALIVMDSWVFGGCCAKKVENLDFLRTSLKGKKLLQRALVMDCIVRGVVCVAFMAELFVIDYLVCGDRLFEEGWILKFTYFVLFAYVIAAIGVFVNRYMSMLLLSVSIAYIIVQVSVAVQALWNLANLPVWLWSVLLLVLTIVFTWLAVSKPVKKLERGYGDEAVEE